MDFEIMKMAEFYELFNWATKETVFVSEDHFEVIEKMQTEEAVLFGV